MKKFFSLLLKDLILMKNYVIFTAVIIVVMPLLFLGLGVAAFAITYMLALYTTMQSLAYYEAKYKNAETALNSTPYSRQAIVISRYVFLLLVYAVTLLIYTLMSLVIPQCETPTVTAALAVLLMGSLLTGVLMPLNYKFGVAKTRYISIIAVAALGFTLPLVASDNGGELMFDFINRLSPILISLLSLLLSVIISVVSAVISIAIYKKKDF